MTSQLEANKNRLAAARAKLGSKQPPSSSNEPLSPIKRALAEISAVEGIQAAFMNVDVNQIDHLFNPRDIPCSLQEIRAIEWPDLGIPVDDVRGHIQAAIEASGQSWWAQKKIEAEEVESVLNFFEGVHQLSQMLSDDQIHNIVVNRVNPKDTRFVLLAGERRVIAALYSRGRIPVLMAKVYTGLSPLQCRKITDQENTSKALKPHETIAAKFAIWEELGEGKETLELKDLARIWHVASGTASILRRLFVHPNRDNLMTTIRKERLGWREIEAVVRGKVAESSPTPPRAANSKHPDEPTRAVNDQLADDTTPPPPLALDPATQNHPPVSTVETTATAPDDEHPPMPNEEASGTTVRAQLQAAGTAESRAAKLGLTLKRNTDLSVIKGVMSLVRESDQLPKRLLHTLRSVDLNDKDALLNAWCELSSVFSRDKS